MRAPLAYGFIAASALLLAPRPMTLRAPADTARVEAPSSASYLPTSPPHSAPHDSAVLASPAAFAADDARDDDREWAAILQRQLRAYSSGGPIEPGREFYFTRAFYSSGRNDLYRGFPSWSVDWPKADVQFMIGLKRLASHLDAYDGDNPVSLADPQLLGFPFLYAVEVGYMSLTEPEVVGLRRYLERGGFLFVDDFWGSREWANFEHEMRRVLPGHPIVELPLDHPIFHAFYDIEEIVQVPNVGQGRYGGPTWEQDGITPTVRGIFDDEGRLMVAISWNSDLGDAWEWAEDPFYPLRFSTYAYQLGVNLIVYSMSH